MGKSRREFPVSTVRVSPTVWREALRAADGKPAEVTDRERDTGGGAARASGGAAETGGVVP